MGFCRGSVSWIFFDAIRTELLSKMCSIMATASIWPGWCFSLWVKWSVNSGIPSLPSAKMADITWAKTVKTLAQNRTMEACPDPAPVPLTNARPSFGSNSKNLSVKPASWKAYEALRVSPLGPITLELDRPIKRPAMYAKGSKSPEAVIEPRRGKQGVMLWLRSLVMASRISNRMPE